MKKQELTDKIINETGGQLYVIVGPNSSGKSYYLDNDLFVNLDNSVVLFDEKGDVRTNDAKSKVSISDGYYLYIDEGHRGNNNSVIDKDIINADSLAIVDVLEEMKKKYDIKYKSYGITKLLNIISSILSYNLNNINFFLFDEPDISLDDAGLRCIGKLFSTLVDNGKRVILVTHNPRLLELMQIEIGNIYVFPKMYGDIINVCKEDVYDVFNLNGKNILNLSSDLQCSKYEMYDFLPETGISKVYVDVLLKRYEFYKVLFYSHVIIMEGTTELFIVHCLFDSLPEKRCVYNANGKYRIPFLLELFSMFGKNITCIFDSDIPEKAEFDRNKIAILLNDYLEKKKKDNQIYIYTIPHDLETYLKVDKDKITYELSGVENLSGKFTDKFYSYYKPYFAYYVVNTQKEKKDSIVKLLTSKSNTYYF